MNYTIENFKAISEFQYENFKDLTILTGINSGGKSSFLHSLLLMKQSQLAGNFSTPIILNGDFVSLGGFEDILNKNEISRNGKAPNSIVYKISYDSNNDFNTIKNFENFMINSLENNYFILSIATLLEDHPNFDANYVHDFNGDGNKIRKWISSSISRKVKSLEISYVLKPKNNQTIISELSFTVEFKGDSEKLFLKLTEYQKGERYNLVTNSPIFFGENESLLLRKTKKLKKNKKLIISEKFSWMLKEVYEGRCKVNFDKLIPLIVHPKNENVNSYFELGLSPFFTRTLEVSFNEYFNSISYLGPLREAPKSLYLKSNDYNATMGSKGENLINIFVQNKGKLIDVPTVDNEGIITTTKLSLIEGLNYWMCQKFDMAKSIEIKEHNNGQISQVLIQNSLGNSVPISSVGFGVSQIMPIIVEGLLLKENHTLILEQPEIHLHPRLQSLLFDFLYAITKQNKKVIVETHSDHLINRLRRRVAEEPIDSNDPIEESIGLFFVENNKMNSILIDEYGIMDQWPTGFFDQSSSENLALVRAQSIKRKSYSQLKLEERNV